MNRLLPALLGAIVLALAMAAGHHLGAVAVQADWDRDTFARVAAEKKAVLDAVAKNEVARQQDLATARATIAEYERKSHEDDARITAERAAADRERLRITIPKRACPAAAGEAAGAGRADAASTVETVELPEPVDRRLRDLAEDADREIAGLRVQLGALQEWIVMHGFYGEVP